MEIFLLISVGVLFIAGILLLLSPRAFKRISDATNKVIFVLDDKLPMLRKPLGILFLAATIYLWYILLYEVYK